MAHEVDRVEPSRAYEFNLYQFKTNLEVGFPEKILAGTDGVMLCRKVFAKTNGKGMEFMKEYEGSLRLLKS